jgi:P4 family phage/plasmid primase-like protien
MLCETPKEPKCGEWRCGGGDKGAQTVVFGVHPEGQVYQIQNNPPPAIISFDQLQWFYPFDQPAPAKDKTDSPPPENGRSTSGSVPNNGPDDTQSAYSQLLNEIGVPFVTTQRGYNINQPYFARLWTINRLAIYDLATKDYYAYTDANGLFRRLCAEEVHGLIRNDLFSEAAARGFPNVGSKISTSLLKSIAELIKCDPVAGKKDFFTHSPRSLPIIHAANGMWRLEEDGSITRHDFDPKFRSRNMIPIPYNPQAKCPQFMSELLEPVLIVTKEGQSEKERKAAEELGRKDIDALQRYWGLILIGGNRAQKILMLLGEGGTGKGTIVRLIGMILGRSNVGQLRVGELNGRFETSKLVGKLLLTVVEASHDCLEQRGAEQLKAMVGHDLLDGEKKYVQDPIPFEGTFPVIYVSNEDPNIRLSGDESAWSRRLVVVQFPNKRPEGSVIIDNFEETLFEEEAEGIFALMVQGARDHWKELVTQKGFATTDAQKRRVEEIISRSKSILTFVLDGLVASKTDDLTTDELYDGYLKFCQDRNWRPFPDRKFAELARPLILQHYGISKSNSVVRTKPNGKDSTVSGYHGIGVK